MNQDDKVDVEDVKFMFGQESDMQWSYYKPLVDCSSGDLEFPDSSGLRVSKVTRQCPIGMA